MKKLFIVALVCALFLTACGTSTTPARVTSPFSTGTNPIPSTSFLYATSTQAIYLSWVNTNGTLVGQIQSAQIEYYPQSWRVISVPSSFTGTQSNTQISLNVLKFAISLFIRQDITVIGTFDNNVLTLQWPSRNGSIDTMAFVSATSDDYNKAILDMQKTADSDNANNVQP